MDKVRPPVELNKAPIGGSIGHVIESRSNKFRVGEYVRRTLVGENIGLEMT
jgi:NADPH-dependent curcumin reductase CurA